MQHGQVRTERCTSVIDNRHLCAKYDYATRHEGYFYNSIKEQSDVLHMLHKPQLWVQNLRI
jgi:5-keto 4-deoxyuronate isomerase